ncbi:hypothetical protein, partial [Sideroxydans sp. CL21]
EFQDTHTCYCNYRFSHPVVAGWICIWQINRDGIRDYRYHPRRTGCGQHHEFSRARAKRDPL